MDNNYNNNSNQNNSFRQLKRSRINRSISGVCGGIGEYFRIDPVVIRLIWVIASFASVGVGVLVYFIAALIIPEEN